MIRAQTHSEWFITAMTPRHGTPHVRLVPKSLTSPAKPKNPAHNNPKHPAW